MSSSEAKNALVRVIRMGSDNGSEYEQPVHTVTVPDFEMLKTEVTVAQYEECVAIAMCSVPDPDPWGDCAPTEEGNWGVAGREDHPVNCVNWDQAGEFCAWIGGRLPSEAEWEYAARSGGQDIDYPWGDETATCSFAVMNDGSDGCGTGHTMDVCSKPAGNTAQGLCDMAGNVREWNRDMWHWDYYGAPTDGSAWEEQLESGRVVRGGGFNYLAFYLRAAGRGVEASFSEGPSLGIRCAR
jgi:formylglycine-generating enzyme required for sulfatase activity